MTPAAPPTETSSANASSGFAPILERNIRALIDRRQQEERRKGLQERLADRISRFTGSMTSVYLHLLVFGGWIAINLGWTPLPKFDESFVKLAMLASVEALFLSTFVLITQNRLAALADKRADLDLQISLLGEHEITRLVQLVSAIAEKMGIDAARDPSLEPLKSDVAPEQVLDHLEAHNRDANGGKP